MKNTEKLTDDELKELVEDIHYLTKNGFTKEGEFVERVKYFADLCKQPYSTMLLAVQIHVLIEVSLRWYKERVNK